MTLKNNVIRIRYIKIWTFVISWFMINKWNRQGLRESVEMPRGQGLLMVVLQRVSLISKKIIGLRRGLLIMFLQNIPRIVMIGCLILRLLREKLLAHQTRSRLFESVRRSIMVITLLGWIISLGFARVATRFGISLIWMGKTKVSGKLVILIWILQWRIIFMQFAPRVNKRVLPM